MSEDSVRIDKWLWAARFFKTRSLAAQAVDGGKVHLNGARVKPARIVVLGDELSITRGEEQFIVRVTATSNRRGSATVAATLFEETPESLNAREEAKAMRRLLAASNPTPQRRPDKKQRRQIRRFSGKD